MLGLSDEGLASGAARVRRLDAVLEPTRAAVLVQKTRDGRAQPGAY